MRAASCGHQLVEYLVSHHLLAFLGVCAVGTRLLGAQPAMSNTTIDTQLGEELTADLEKLAESYVTANSGGSRYPSRR
jgi:hypothetical protein